MGLGTYARYNTITALALKKKLVSGSLVDQFLYVADYANNKILQVELTSGTYVMSTFDPFDVNSGPPIGLTVYGNNVLYCSVPGGLYRYNLLIGLSSRVVFSGSVSPYGNSFIISISSNMNNLKDFSSFFS